MRQPDLIHDPLRPSVRSTPRVVQKLEHQPVANQIRRMQSDRLLQLQKLVGPLVGRVKFPPELKAEQALVEAA